MSDLRARISAHAAAGDHEAVVNAVSGVPIDQLHYKILFPVAQALVALSRPKEALPYVVRSFYVGPVYKKIIMIRKLVQATGERHYLDEIVEFVLEKLPEDSASISYLAPFLPEFDSVDAVTPQRRLIAFYSFAEKGRSREAVEIGRQLIADGCTSPALRARMSNLLLSLGQVQEALSFLEVNPIEHQDAREDLRPVARSGSVKSGYRLIFVCDVVALGDFLQRLTIACKAKANAPSCQVIFCYRPDRAFKEDLVRWSVGIDQFLRLEDLSSSAIMEAVGEANYRRSLVLETDCAFLLGVGSYTGKAWLRVPAEEDAALTAELTAAGVDPNRWFATLHYRQGNSAPTPHLDPIRDVQSGNFHELAKYIIEDLGGQVVRLGHPGMDRAPTQPGYIDLSEGSIALQLFATARSRFLIGTDSGMVSFSVGLATPTGRTNVTYDIVQENPGDIILLRNLISLDGYVISLEDQFAPGKSVIAMARLPADRNFKLFDNTPEQLKVVAERLFGSTRDVEGWRQAPPSPQPGDGSTGPFPMNWRRAATVIDLAEILGVPVRKF